MNIPEIINDLQTRFAALKSDIDVSQPNPNRPEVVVHVMGYFEPAELLEVVSVANAHELVISCADTFDGENSLVLYSTN